MYGSIKLQIVLCNLKLVNCTCACICHLMDHLRSDCAVTEVQAKCIPMKRNTGRKENVMSFLYVIKCTRLVYDFFYNTHY